MTSTPKSAGKFKRTTRLDGSESDDSTEPSDTCEATGGKRMKKDDSGITVEENASSEENNCPESRQPKNESTEQNSLDSGNIEPDRFADLKLEEGCSTVSSASADIEASTSTSHSHKEKKLTNFTKRLASKSSSSDSDISSDKDSVYESDHNYGKTKNNKALDPTPNTPRPSHKWQAPIAVISRQYGFSQKQSPDYFRYNCYGSLHMVERLELMHKMKKHDGCVNALHFNACGTKLVSGSDDLAIVIWDWTSGTPILDYNSGHRSNVFQAKFMPMCQDTLIVSCGRDGQVRVGEFSSAGEYNKTRKVAQHKGAAHKLALQMDSTHTFLSCGEDGAVFQVDLRAEKPEKLVICKENAKKVPLYAIYANPLKSFEYVVGGRNQFVKVYDTRCTRENKGYLRNICPEHLATEKESDAKNVTSVVYNYNGGEILASYNDEDIYSFCNKSTNDDSKYLHRYKGHKNSQTVKGVNYFGLQSEFIISGSDCGFIFFWERESEHIVQYMYGDEGGVVNCLEPNPNLPVLATSGLDDDIKLWVPSCENPPDLSDLKKHLISNMREREEERRNCPEAFIDQTIWFLMQHLARSRGGGASPFQDRAGRDETDLSSSSDSDVEEIVSRREMQCNPS